MKHVYEHIGGQDWPTEGLVLSGSAEPIKLGDIVVIKMPDGTSLVFNVLDGMCEDCHFFNEGSVPCPHIIRLRQTIPDPNGSRINTREYNCSKTLCAGCYDDVNNALIFKSIDEIMENL